MPTDVESLTALPSVDGWPSAVPVLFEFPAPAPMNWWFVAEPLAAPCEALPLLALPLKVMTPLAAPVLRETLTAVPCPAVDPTAAPTDMLVLVAEPMNWWFVAEPEAAPEEMLALAPPP